MFVEDRDTALCSKSLRGEISNLEDVCVISFQQRAQSAASLRAGYVATVVVVDILTKMNRAPATHKREQLRIAEPQRCLPCSYAFQIAKYQVCFHS